MTLRLRYALRACHRWRDYSHMIIGHDNQAALTADTIVNDNANGTRKTETENLNCKRSMRRANYSTPAMI